MKINQPDLEVNDTDLLKAVCIRFSECFPAMNFARAFGGGSNSTPWKIMEQFTPREILQEVELRELDISDLAQSCSDNLVVESKLYLKITIDEQPK